MREILFRGQTKSGEWHFGFFIKRKGIANIFKNGMLYEVEPETVGQLLYTNNRRQYFDGDIFKHKYYPDCFCRVYFSEQLLAVVGRIYDKDGEYELVTILPSDFEDKMKLVSNIHENPELLK